MGGERKAEVKAGGGVVVRDGAGGLEVAVVHRPRYDDWSLPKGKLEPGESFEEGALREVEEETGLVCELGDELSPISYHDRKGRLKLVRYWTMTAREGEFAPNEEVDVLEWLPPAEAAERLDYEHDRKLLTELPGAAEL
ncbi:MAG: NUDIX hydrolase [Solirubrobacterales bacterium]